MRLEVDSVARHQVARAAPLEECLLALAAGQAAEKVVLVVSLALEVDAEVREERVVQLAAEFAVLVVLVGPV